MITRRYFLSKLTGSLGAPMLWPVVQGCESPPSFEPKLSGPNFSLGHRLRTMDFGPVTEHHYADIVIIGGGIAGLSAARYLKKFTNNFLLLELGQEAGGNSVASHNSTTSYPWGAHYIPIPGNNDSELIDFLQESNVITGFAGKLPVYNEYYLCFDPKERLYINNYWQEGVLPHEGVPEKDRDELERFVHMMQDFKNKKGSDGHDAFAIPVDQSSKDPSLLMLDTITMEEFLRQNNFSSPYLLWYVNYCCADDYGASVKDTSAWAAIHYFASRKGIASNAPSDAVLTWPEGNSWLVTQLSSNLGDHIKTDSLAFRIKKSNHGMDVEYFDANTNTSKKVTAKSIILSTPQFISQRLLQDMERPMDYSQFQYAPWMVANITTNATLNEKRGEPLSWDNVFYGSSALGYVNATHQNIAGQQEKKVITYYQPLLGADPVSLRKQAHLTSANQWSSSVLSELSNAHPGIEKKVQDMEIWLWGHGMIKPVPGFIWGANRQKANLPVNDRIHFAHSDLSGISIFEEAFFKGHTAAAAALKSI
jgi:NAD(P)-binding Rossmann-like domain